MSRTPKNARRAPSAASRVFFVFVGAVVAIASVVGVALVVVALVDERREAETLTLAVARSVAADPAVADAVAAGGADATDVLQPIALEITSETPIDFVTIMTPAGIRLTHPDPAQIGLPYLGTIAEASAGGVVLEEFTGTLGPSVRAVVPVLSGDRVVGLVAAGVTVQSVAGQLWGRIPAILALTAALVVIGTVAAWLARRLTRRVAGDLPASAVRDAVSSYESVRTLGEALRAQAHEHGNRMHTAVALIELGRAAEAIELLTERTRESQELVDRMTPLRAGEPAVEALLLGKASQASELGVGWNVDIDPGAPRSVLGPVDAVSVVGNLIDNAIDAAAAGDEPRWVRVRIRPAGTAVAVSVSDSGPPISAEVSARMFDRGFSTKPAGPSGRGVGLALVRDIVAASGGEITVNDSPTTFRVVLPGRTT
ncbi:sensor histidine kinase [Microbacterium lacus]|uniref:sensor histidine kinase n=1 Tax=Microbacterium lacus TaxID=415217 RepID=UPI001E2D4B07|nr:ATP-binding protein [Microbacterium lacus]